MKKIFLIIVSVLIYTCDSENAFDCFQNAGPIIEETKDVAAFERIFVNRDITLVIKEGLDYTVRIETGKNLINEVTAEVIGNQLILTDNNTCNFVRDFGITKIFITAPNLTEITTSTQFEILSDGVLNYNSLRLISEDFSEQSENTVGDFRLKVNSEDVAIVSNNISLFYLEGMTNNLFIEFSSGSGRFEGENLIAQHVSVSHRGSNDMIVNPIQSISGLIRGTGNVIAVHEPPVIDVEEVYIGRLIFN